MESPTHKVVNGERVELTVDEIAEIHAEWSSNAVVANADTEFTAAIMAGFLTSYGWSLPIDDDSRNNLIQLRTQIAEGLALGAWTDDSPCPVQLRDTAGALHDLSIAETRTVIFLAGNYYAQTLQQYRAVVDGSPS